MSKRGRSAEDDESIPPTLELELEDRNEGDGNEGDRNEGHEADGTVIPAPNAWELKNVEAIIQGHGSDFSAHLFRLLARADRDNLQRMRLSAPHHVDAVVAWRKGAK
jgi:hypothetical protein